MAAPTLVQSIGHNGAAIAAGATTTAAMAAPTVTGRDLLVLVTWQTSNTTMPVITDNKGNTYTQSGTTVSITSGGYTYCLALAVCRNATGGAGHTFTATKASAYPSLCGIEISGANAATLIDAYAGNNDTASPFVTSSITPSVNDCLVLSATNGYAATTQTPGSPFTTVLETGDAASVWQMTVAQYTQATAAAVSCSWTTNTSEPSVLVIFAIPPAVAGGAMVGAASMSLNAAGTLAGAGAIAGTSALSIAPAGTLRGAGATVGAATISLTTAGTLVGAGALAGATTLTLAPAGALTGAGLMVGATTITLSASGAIVAPSDMIGAATLGLTATGDLTATGALVGTVALSLTPAATLSGAGALVGAAALSLTAAGAATANGVGELVGNASITFAANGTIATTVGIAGSASLSLAPAGTLAGRAALVGNATLALDAAATGYLVGNMSGAAIIAFAATAELLGRAALVGSAGFSLVARATPQGYIPPVGADRIIVWAESAASVVPWFEAAVPVIVLQEDTPSVVSEGAVTNQAIVWDDAP